MDSSKFGGRNQNAMKNELGTWILRAKKHALILANCKTNVHTYQENINVCHLLQSPRLVKLLQLDD